MSGGHFKARGVVAMVLISDWPVDFKRSISSGWAPSTPLNLRSMELQQAMRVFAGPPQYSWRERYMPRGIYGMASLRTRRSLSQPLRWRLFAAPNTVVISDCIASAAVYPAPRLAFHPW